MHKYNHNTEGLLTNKELSHSIICCDSSQYSDGDVVQLRHQLKYWGPNYLFAGEQ